jgi:oligoendopeptidase F
MFTSLLFPTDFSYDLPKEMAEGGAGSAAFGDLPEWNLDDLYPSTDGAEITRDLKWLGGECADFARDYEG